jgi:Na+:H+ antiporter, NhaA family
MLTLAVVDDLGTIAVIAVFFSGGIALGWLAGAAAALAAVVIAQRNEIRFLPLYVLLAALLWLAIFESGVHGTIAGVLLGFLTTADTFHGRNETAERIAGRLGEITSAEDEEWGRAPCGVSLAWRARQSRPLPGWKSCSIRGAPM